LRDKSGNNRKRPFPVKRNCRRIFRDQENGIRLPLKTYIRLAGICLGLQGAWIAAQVPDGPESRLPESEGIAANYAGDRGIEGHPAVVFVERFEGTLEEVAARWEEVRRQDIFSLSEDVPPGAGSARSLLMSHTGGDGTGGHLYRPLLPGYDRLFWRFYVKMDPEAGPLHHTPRIGGFNPPSRRPTGPAGQRPSGDANFRVGIGPHYGPDQSWDYYVYWQEMRGSPPAGQTWGNTFIGHPLLRTERGRWTCVEVMVKLNQPGERDGELAFWLDGKLVSHLGPGFPRGAWIFDKFRPRHPGPGARWNDEIGDRETIPGDLPFEGFEWRTTEELKINFIWMLLYITRAPNGHLSRVWFDHIVASEEYIGPLGRREALMECETPRIGRSDDLMSKGQDSSNR
jgi:hypothetical protein